MSQYAFINGVILDGTKNMEPVHGKAILVKDGRIEKIVAGTYPLAGYDIVDLQGKYIMPGLINLHVHLPISGKPSKKKRDPKKTVKFLLSNPITRQMVYNMGKKHAEIELMSGVTTLRTVGGLKDFDTKLRDAINAGKANGPRVLAANEAVTCRGGHMEGSVAVGADTKEEIYREVDRLYHENVDLIKLMITGGVLDAKEKGVPGELKMTPELVAAACERAHAYGLQVAAHCEGVEGVKVGLRNGVDSIEHGAMPDEEMAKAFHEGKHWLCATFSPAVPFALFDPEITGVDEVGQYNGKVLFKGMISCIKYCLENDVAVGLGNDVGCPWITHYDFWRELCYFKKYSETSNAFTLYTATLNNAALVGLDHEIGSIEEGKIADMIITKENPLDNLEALRNVDLVIHEGKMVHPNFKKDPVIEEQLDKYL